MHYVVNVFFTCCISPPNIKNYTIALGGLNPFFVSWSRKNNLGKRTKEIFKVSQSNAAKGWNMIICCSSCQRVCQSSQSHKVLCWGVSCLVGISWYTVWLYEFCQPYVKWLRTLSIWLFLSQRVMIALSLCQSEQLITPWSILHEKLLL